jgi:AcrR family transcriptional regulator
MALLPASERTNRPSGTGRSVAERLNEALAVLGRAGSGGEVQDRVTVAALCRRADVSRNTLYRYHPDALEALRELRRQQQSLAPGELGTTIRNLRSEVTSLHAQLRQVAALVDHYYAAHRETQELLERRDRELAQLRRSAQSSPIALRR